MAVIWRSSRRLAAAALVALSTGLYGTAGAAAGLDAEQRREIAALKADAIERIGSMQAEAMARRYPARTRLSIYVGVDVPSFVLEKATVYVDGRELVTRRYRRDEAAVLTEGHAHRIVRTNVEPGSHKVRVQFSGRLRRALGRGPDPDSRPITGEIDMDFEKSANPKALILAMAPEALRPTRRLSPSEWKWRSEVEDPRFGMVRFLRQTGDNYRALLELLEIAAGVDATWLAPKYHALRAHSYLDFDMEPQARRALASGLRAGLDEEAENDIRLRLAALAFERGRVDETAAILSDIRPDLTTAQLVHWQGLMARLLMGKGRYREAVEVLTQGDTELEVLTEPGSEDKQTLYMRYNYAVALLQAGGEGGVRGRTLLDRLGRMRPFTPAQWGLRDQANLTLAYHFLDAGQGATAKKIFQRIRLDGPLAETALLGLGWAELAPRGERQSRVAVGDEPEPGTYGITDTRSGRFERDDMPERFSADAFRQVELVPFKQADQAESEEARRRRALVAWEELATRQPEDNAVQEARIAAAYTLETLGAEDSAMTRYRREVAALEEMHDSLRARIEALRAEDAVVTGLDGAPSLAALTRNWQRRYTPGLDDARWLEEFYVSAPVHELAGHYLDLYLLALAMRGRLPLADAGDTGTGGSYKGADLASVGATDLDRDEGLVARMDTAAAALQQRLRGVTADALERQLAELEEYIAAARLGLARLYEKRLAHAGQVTPGDTLAAVPIARR